MNITWHGQSCFQISSSEGKNNHVSIVIDPFEENIGLKLPRKLEADIVLVTHDHSDHNNVKAVSGQPLIINGPGEYEAKGVFIQGISAFHDNSRGAERGNITIYTIEAEGMRLCHLGDLGQKELTSGQLDKIGEVDILMIPVGAVYTINAGEAIKVMAQIEPKITIPMHYQIQKLKIHPVKSSSPSKIVPKAILPGQAGISPKAKLFNGVKLGGVDKFLKGLGVKKLEPLPKLSIKKKDLSSEEVKIIVLQP